MLEILFFMSFLMITRASDITNSRNSSNFGNGPINVTCDYNLGEYKYVYTKCNKKDDRWKVAVPKKDSCGFLKNAPNAEKGLKCSFRCQAGEFLNVEKQICESCLPGTYSVGDGKRFTEWSKLPEGFSTHGQKPEGTDKKEGISCLKAGWSKDKFGDSLQSSGSSCKSILMYEVQLDNPGNISFTVSANDEQSFLHVWVQSSGSCGMNEYSQNMQDQNMEKYLSGMNTTWTTYTLGMKKGSNMVYFEASYFPHNLHSSPIVSADRYSSDEQHAVMIKEIEVRGFAYATKCEPCEVGTYSGFGFSKCRSCPENTFSGSESKKCIKCDKNFYSESGASHCKKRLPCVKEDYQVVWKPCENGKTRKVFSWKEPHICLPQSSLQLPKPGPLIDCPPCNPGQSHNKTNGLCSFCPKGTYNGIGKGECKRCPPATEDAPGLFYTNWSHMPPFPMRLFCLAKPDTGCKSSVGWELHSSFISTGFGHADDARLVLYLLIPGFTKGTAKLTIDFEIECSLKNCRTLFQSVTNGNVHRIKQWDGSVKRITWVHTHHGVDPIRFRFIFEKEYNDEKQTFKYKDSRARIFSLQLTNVIGGGTKKCHPCVVEQDQGCLSCGKGEYMDLSNSKCKKCPAGTFIADTKDATAGLSACKQCPYGTQSNAGSTFCSSDCTFKVPNGGLYNFSSLKGYHLVKGNNLFTTKGFMYYHLYNVSLCGGVDVQCVDNSSTPESGSFAPISGSVCRSTMIPDNGRIISAQSISLGDAIQEVTSISDFTDESNANKSDNEIASTTTHLHFQMFSKRKTDVCPEGTNSSIRLVCDPNQSGMGHIESGNKECKSETCNGCEYPFTWHTSLACPLCTANDYLNITSACVDGKKKVHYLWKLPHVCSEGQVKKPLDEELVCTIFEKSIMDLKIIIFAFLGFAFLLAIIVLILCYRNRRLNYKYHRLIDGQNCDDELPPAAKCALEEDEEEDEYIVSKIDGGKPRILDRLKGLTKSKKRGEFSEFETINLDLGRSPSDDENDEI